MIHFMAPIYANTIEIGTRTLEDVMETDKKGGLVRKSTAAVLCVRRLRDQTLTFDEICGKDGLPVKEHYLFGIAKDDTVLQDLIKEYAEHQKVTII